MLVSMLERMIGLLSLKNILVCIKSFWVVCEMAKKEREIVIVIDAHSPSVISVSANMSHRVVKKGIK